MKTGPPLTVAADLGKHSRRRFTDLNGANEEREMPNIRAKLIGAFGLTIVLITAGLQPAFAAKQLPFKATFSGVISPPHGPPPVNLSGTGTASYLGTSTNSGHVAVTGPSSCANGFAVQNDESLTSTDDGDQITLTIRDESCPIAPGVYLGAGTYVITGGTGRFAGATGSGSFDGRGDFNLGEFTFSLNGTISQPQGS